MANKDDYLTFYREFFENFAQTVNPNDQLPVKLASYKLVNIEVVGGIIDWTTQYLTQKKCPSNLVAPLIKTVIEEIRKACKKQPVNCGFNITDNAYEPLKLMQTVMAKTNEVCLRYLDNSMLCSLPSPGTPFCITSASAIKNSRKRMEDRHVVIHDLNTMFNIQEASPSSYYAVFDGHAGHDAATYSAAHLHQYLAESKYFITNPEQALLDAFCKTDALFLDKCKVENLSSGTTAVVALLRPKEKTLYVAWAGDSQAMLVKQERVFQVVNPHKPCRQDEKERIEKEGGCVILWGTWRVNGQLAVSRAIGDADYKPYVIAVPEIREISLDGGEDFLVIACDGLWDFLSEDYVAHAIYLLITENPDDTERVSHHLVRLAKENGSLDNISVIVVFLREPSKILADAHWANRNLNPVTMDAGLDNANNPFAISNGATTDNIISQKSEGLLLNLTDNFKKNGSELSPTTDYYEKEKSNGKRSASEFDDDDDFGPETDVDAVDDVLSPLETTKGFTDAIDNNNPFDEGVYNPFMEHQEKATLEMERNLQKQDSGEFEEPRMAREETPTPPADAVHDVRGLEENVADSDSEDEWNYIKGEEANKENISPVPEQKVADIPEEDDNMSQLNPNAAEFVPVSPTRSVPSPACRVLINDLVISQSPKRPVNELDINLPNPSDFEKEVKSRPSEVESYSNGHNGDSDSNTTPTDLMEGILNGKNIDEIPEFQPGSTPKKVLPSDEFHFGPNAAPFTPVRLLDQSEAALSTRAIYGDESFATVETSFNESDATEDVATDLNTLNKESDPMSMSFYADKGDSNPFDLDKVQVLPENLDEFLKQPDTENFDETISDLPEHHPLGEPQQSSEPILNNDDALQITDLDKHSYDDEKELASPLEPDSDVIEIEKDSSEKDSSEKDLLGGVEETDFSKTPEPRYENLLEEKFCHVSEKSESLGELPANVEVISPSPTPEIISPEPRTESPEKSIQSTNEDLSCERPHSLENIPHDVELLSPETMERLSESPRPDVSEKEVTSPVEEQASEVSDLLKKPESTEVDQFLNRPEDTEVSDLLLQPEAEEVSDLLGRPEANESSDLLSQPKAEEVDDFLNQPEATEVDDLLNQPEATEISNLLEQSNSTVTNNVQNQLDDVLKQPVATEVSNLLGQPESLEKEDLNKQTEVDVKLEKLIHPEVSDLLNEPDINEVSNTLVQPVDEFLEQPRPNDVEEVMERTELHDMLEHPKVSECDELSKLAETAEVANLEVQETLTKVCELSLAKSPELLEVSEPAVIASESPVSKSPLPENENIESFTPVCQLPCMKEPEEVGENEVKESQLAVCEPPVSKSPAVELFESKSPICEITESKSSVCDLSESKSPFPDEVVGSVQSDSGDLESPASPDFTRPELIEQAQVHFVELCHPTEDIHHTESPQEDITSSVRDDDITSPVSPPVNDVIEDSFIAEQPTVCAVAQDITSFVLEAGSPSSSLNRELEVPSPKSIADTESVATTDVNSFLERSLPPEVNSPLSTTEDEIEKDLYSNNPLHKCVYPLPPQPTSEEIDIKTENISPEFAEQTVVTPSEESKQEEIPVISLLESSVVEPVVEEKPESKELAGEVTAVGVVAAVATGAAIAAVASATKVEENKKSTVASTKKLSVSKSSMATSKSTPKQSPVPKTTSRPSASPRVAPSKTGAPKSSVTAAPKAAPPKPQTKPKSSLPPKPAEKKPATSSDLKSAVKSATTVKKITSESVTKTASTNKSTTAASKVSPTKAAPSRPAAATSRPTAAPRPAPAPKAALTRPTTAVNTAAKARPTTLTNKPLASSSPSKTTSSVTKVTLSKTSPRTATAPPKPKLAPTNAPAPKPRVPLSKTVSKAPDTEKQNKESANKLTASRSVTSTTKTTGTATSRTTSSSVRRVESKVSATRTTQSKTTTTTMKSTTGKKPIEIIRNASSKTKTTTKIEKPKENEASIVTEEISVNNISSTIDSEPQLVKDNSPIDNKLITESTLIQTNTAD